MFERNPIFGIIATIAAIILLTSISSSSLLNMRITGATGSSNLSHFHDQTLYTSKFYFIPPSSNSNGLHRILSNSRTYFVHPLYSTSSGNISSVVSNNKVIILGFDDGWKSQITYAKPILDKYGFKASFFVVCNYVNSGDIGRMNWQDIAALQKDGMDIESHSMTHTPYLNILHQRQLDYEIGGSKQCLATHGYNSRIFAYPYNSGSTVPAVIGTDDQLMKYLYDNHFKVLTYKHLGYNTQTNTFYFYGIS